MNPAQWLRLLAERLRRFAVPDPGYDNLRIVFDPIHTCGLSWQAATLVFLVGGTPPYTVSLGRAGATPTSQPLNQVAPGFTQRELAQLEQAQAGQGAATGNSAATQAGLSSRQRTYILWGVLILSLKLIRRMRAGPDKVN